MSECVLLPIKLKIPLSVNHARRAGSVNNFGTSRENREMGQDLEWDNGDEATTTSAKVHNVTATVQKYTMYCSKATVQQCKM